MRIKVLLAALALAVMPSLASAQATFTSNTTFPNPFLSVPGATFTAPVLLPNGTAPAVALRFSASAAGTGWYSPDGSAWDFASGGTAVIRIAGTSFSLLNAASSLTITDAVITRDAANTLALRNAGTAGTPVPQTFNVYNFCDGANCVTGYERGIISFAKNANSLDIGTEFAGTGAGRGIRFSPGGTTKWLMHPTTGALYPASDDSVTIGSVSPYLIANAYFARSIQGSKSKTLTDAAAAASVVRIAVPTNGFAGGSFIYTATSTDGTNILVTQNTCQFAAADTAGTVTAGTPTCATPSTAYKRANTLVCTITGAVSTTNYDIQASCTDNLAGSQTVSINYRLDMPQPNTVTPQ